MLDMWFMEPFGDGEDAEMVALLSETEQGRIT
jgi:hypothetical protein